jgi:HEAT repeat-containing protein 5
LAVPAQIEPMLSSCKSELQKHLDVLSETGVPHGRIGLGIAQGLAAVVQVCSYRPLYFSTDVVTEIWTLANSLLQLSAKSDLRSSQIQIQVSWNLIGALMTSGAQFVKPRINQLLLLWQNALPRSFPRESMASRNNADLQYLLHVREKALAALYLFLQYNSKLLTQDTSKRIATMLSDTNTFVGRIPSAPLTDDARLLASHSQLTEIAVKVKMRVFRCYCRLVDHDIRKIAGPELLMNAISVFVESEPQTSKFVVGQQTIVTSFKSLNYTTDNYACGVSSYFNYLSIPDEGADRSQGRHWSIWDSDSEALEQMVLFLRRCRGADRQLAPIMGALENDITQIYGYAGESIEVPLPVPPMTALVDSAIDLFSQMVLDQPVKIQESAFAQIAACISDITLSRNAGRKAAVTNNIVIALSKAFTSPTNRGLKGISRSGRVRTLVLDILQVRLILFLFS